MRLSSIDTYTEFCVRCGYEIHLADEEEYINLGGMVACSNRQTCNERVVEQREEE